MNFKFAAPLIVLASSAFLQAQQPDPKAIMEGARMAATLVVLEDGLTGSLTRGRQKVPITLYLKGENIQFQYQVGGVWRIFHMLLDDDFRLSEVEPATGKTTPFPPARLTEHIAGTDLTYEDLALRFFYWPNPVLAGTENINGELCYKIRIPKPRGQAGRYETVLVWVHTKFGAFMRICGYDARGGLVKEFQVQNVMKVADDVWTLEKMQVSSHDPATGRRNSISNLHFDKPKRLAPRGVR